VSFRDYNVKIECKGKLLEGRMKGRYCKENLLSRYSPRYLTSSSLGSCTLFIWTGKHVSLRVVNVTLIYLDPLAFILHFLNQIWIASRSVCSSCGAMAGSLSVATTAKVAVIDSGEVGRPVVYRSYNNGPGTVPWSALALTGAMYRKMYVQQFFYCCLCIRCRGNVA
jgi:hypothetical protein